VWRIDYKTCKNQQFILQESTIQGNSMQPVPPTWNQDEGNNNMRLHLSGLICVIIMTKSTSPLKTSILTQEVALEENEKWKRALHQKEVLKQIQKTAHSRRNKMAQCAKCSSNEVEKWKRALHEQ